MPYSDLREFMARLEKEGELQRIEEEVDWNLEAGAMTRLANETGLPAPFFQKIRDYPRRYRLLGEPLGSHRRIAIAMDMDPAAHVREIIQEYLKRKQSPRKPILVKDGPCKENIRMGAEIDLLQFPVPLIHEGDCGRYIGTWHVTICRDPESDWVNWGTYRHLLHDKNTLGLQANPQTHIMKIRQNWDDRGRPMEIAIAIGTEPISSLCAAAPIPYGVSEADVAGGIRGEPVALVPCETVDLQVPATAEIVIEGVVGMGEVREEGPFGEYTGYMGGHREPRPVIHVQAVTYRNEPILTMCNEGMPVNSSHATQTIARSAECLEILRTQGVPVAGVYEFTEACTLLVVVAVKSGRARADDVAHAIWASRLGSGTPWVVVVEEDVDPFDLKQVLHALVSKCHPSRGIVRLDRARGTALIPFLSRQEQKHLLGARAYFDCTWPPEWEPSEVPQKCSFRSIYPRAIQDQAMAKWHRSGGQKGSKIQ